MIAINTPANAIDNGICIPTAAFANGGHSFLFFVIWCHSDARLAVKESSLSAASLSIFQGFAARQDGSTQQNQIFEHKLARYRDRRETTCRGLKYPRSREHEGHCREKHASREEATRSRGLWEKVPGSDHQTNHDLGGANEGGEAPNA